MGFGKNEIFRLPIFFLIAIHRYISSTGYYDEKRIKKKEASLAP